MPSWMTLGANIGCLCLFVRFMPMNTQHCREWVAKKSWRNNEAVLLNSVASVVPFGYTKYHVFVSFKWREVVDSPSIAISSVIMTRLRCTLGMILVHDVTSRNAGLRHGEVFGYIP